MPARRDYTPEELAAKLERDRDRARVGMRRLRQQRRVNATPVNPTPIKEGTVTLTPSQTLPVGEKTLKGGEETRAAAICSRFEQRGYRDAPAFWAKMRGRYPGVDLELEAMKLAEWLEAPKNAKALCSKARIDNWLAKAAAELAAPRSNGHTNGVVHQPNSLRHNRQPDAPRLLTGDLVPVRRDDFSRFVVEGKRLTPRERMARWTGGGK
jgi:hypothetical protein